MYEDSSSDGESANKRREDALRRLTDGGMSTTDGLVTLESDASVAESVRRVTDAIEDNGDLSLMTTVDHAGNAESVDRDLPPTTVLVFGNPDIGTPLMLASRTLAIDLPQKLLIMERDDGTVMVAYNDTDFLADRHGIDGEDERLDTVGDALSSLAATAAGQD
jgi:uncharacterized protein (DUF302 family)